MHVVCLTLLPQQHSSLIAQSLLGWATEQLPHKHGRSTAGPPHCLPKRIHTRTHWVCVRVHWLTQVVDAEGAVAAKGLRQLVLPRGGPLALLLGRLLHPALEDPVEAVLATPAVSMHWVCWHA